jgi:ubiquinone/menaquinone biosynthesis C-methylase UbiE
MSEASDAKSLSRERYGRLAEGYVTSEAHAKGQDLARLVEIARPQPDWVVLDVATGGGHTALKFAPHVSRVTATDITPRMLEKAEVFVRENGIRNVEFRPADAEDLPFDDESYDLVTCRIAPHHFPDPARFVREGARVLRPGGLLLVQDHVLPDDGEVARYVGGFERLRDPSHNRAYSEREWVGMYRAAGLEVEHAEQMVKQHQFIAWAERQNCGAETMTKLVRMIDDAPEAVAEWLQPREFGTPRASFVNHHLIISGRKL